MFFICDVGTAWQAAAVLLQLRLLGLLLSAAAVSGRTAGSRVNSVCTADTLLQVTLWNTGEDPYQHQCYGDCPTVERVIGVRADATAPAAAAAAC